MSTTRFMLNNTCQISLKFIQHTNKISWSNLRLLLLLI